MKKWFIGFILLIAVAVLAACGGNDNEKSKRYDGRKHRIKRN